MSEDLRYISNRLGTIKRNNPDYTQLDDMSILKAIVFNEAIRQDNKSNDGFNLATLEDGYYSVKVGETYVYLKDDGTLRTTKYKGSIVSKSKLLRQKFDINMAVNSGLLKLEKAENLDKTEF